MGSARLVRTRQSRLITAVLVLVLACLWVGRIAFRSAVIEMDTTEEIVSMAGWAVLSFVILVLLALVIFRN